MLSVFDPVLYSLQENEFFLEQLGKPPIVALSQLPSSVNITAVKPVVERVYELMELEKHSGTPWCGLGVITDKIKVYLAKAAQWQSDSQKSAAAPRFPSMHSYDARRRAHRSGPGSDSGQVRTYFGPDGQRIPFAVELVPTGDVEWSADWVTADLPAKGAGIQVNQDANRVECFCGHTESFNPESRGSFNAARARMSKHLRTAKADVERHREVQTAEFGA